MTTANSQVAQPLSWDVQGDQISPAVKTTLKWFREFCLPAISLPTIQALAEHLPLWSNLPKWMDIVSFPHEFLVALLISWLTFLMQLRKRVSSNCLHWQVIIRNSLNVSQQQLPTRYSLPPQELLADSFSYPFSCSREKVFCKT